MGVGMRHQPQGRVTIDWSNPITQGLTTLLWMGDDTPRDLISPGLPYAHTGPAGTVYRSAFKNARGWAVSHDANTTAGIGTNRGVFGVAKQTGAVSVIHVGGNHKVDGNARILFGVGDGQNGGYCVFNSYGKVLGRCKTAGGILAREAELIGSGSVIGMTISLSSAQMWLDGRKTGAAMPRAGDILYDNTYGHVQAFGNVEGQPATGGIGHYGAAWSRDLSEQEMRSLAQNPWQLFASTADEFEPAEAEVVGNSTDPQPGALGITGQVPSVARTAHLALTPAATALALAGGVPTISRSQHVGLAPSPGALTFAGHAPAISQSAASNIAPSAGTLTITPYAPVVDRTAHQALVPSVSALNLTGYAPAIARQEGQAITPASSALAIAGHAPSVARQDSKDIAPAAGAITPTGQVPSVARTAQQWVAPSTGALTPASFAPTVARTAHQVVTPTDGALSAFGFAPTISQTGPLFPAADLVAAGTVYGPNRNDFVGTYVGGLTGQQAAILTALAQIHGLVAGSPLVVTQTSRAAGNVAQAISEASGAVTIGLTAPIGVEADQGTGNLTAEQHTMLMSLALIHGLVDGAPLTVTQAARTAGPITQTISESNGTVTIERA